MRETWAGLGPIADRATVKITRRLVQLGFLTLTIVGVYIWQGNAERWCPFGGVEGIYTYVTEGNLVCSLGVSNFYILGGVLLMTLLVRRAFCSHICPIGTLSEWLHGLGGRVGLPRLRVAPRADRLLSLLKYVALVIILWVTWSAAELHFRVCDPCYALISRHGEDITMWAYIVAGAIVLASLVLTLPFCRWLCPLAAVLNPFSRIGVGRIQRGAEACVDCGACAAACPVAIPVDRCREVTAARCLACMNCVTVCPTRAEGALRFAHRGAKSAWPYGVVVAVVLGCVGVAVAAAYAVPLPSFTREWGTPPAQSATVELRIRDLTCRGRATLLVYYLERDDEYALAGYRRLEAWPGPGEALVRITYDPAATDETAIKDAIVEAYFDLVGRVWRPSPFEIVGYDPLGLGASGSP